MQQISERTTLTPEQVASYLQVNTETVYRYIRTGQLPAIRLGRYYRVPQESLTRFLLTHSTDPKLEQALTARYLSIAERSRNVLESDVVRDVEEAVREVRRQT